MHQDIAERAIPPRRRGTIDCAQVCDFTDAEKEQHKEIDEDKKKLEMQADMGKFLLLLGFGMLYYFWVSYDVVPPIIDRAAQLLGFARFARVGDLKRIVLRGSRTVIRVRPSHLLRWRSTRTRPPADFCAVDDPRQVGVAERLRLAFRDMAVAADV